MQTLVDQAISKGHLDTTLEALTLSSLNTQTADYDTAGFQITNSSAPVTDSDLVNKFYVDS